MHIQPYLFFNGRCEEAVNYYRQAIGAEIIMLSRFKDSPQSPPPDVLPPDSDNKIMHTTFRIGDTEVMASDGRCSGQLNFQGFSLSLAVSSQEIDRIFAALADGGRVDMPLEETFWSPRFGMVTDRFGVQWMINMES